MATGYSPRIVTDGLVLALDAGNPVSFTPSSLSVEYLVIAGGGGGSNRHKGGGGAGGVLAGNLSIPTGSHSIVIGAGGNGAPEEILPSVTFGTNGGNSTFFNLTAIGGGRTNNIGGSGGGGGAGNVGPSGTLNQGNAGGNGSYVGGGFPNQSSYAGGGGGGAGSAGSAATTATPSRAGDGGSGISSDISGIPTLYAGGGGGGSAVDSVDAGSGWGSFGGSGGGGNGGRGGAGQNGTQNTGAGGGAGGFSNTINYVSGAGGSGIVIVRYKGPQKATGGTVTRSGDWTIHAFTSSGNFVVGDVWGDLTRIGNNATLLNGPTFSSSNLGSLVFDGVNDYISLSNITNPNGPYTIIQWLKPNTPLLAGGSGTNKPTGSNRKVTIVGPGPVWNPGIWVTSDYIRVHAKTQYIDASINWTTTTWNMIGMTYDGVNCKIIFNGNFLPIAFTTSYGPSNPTLLHIASETAGGTSTNWNGTISSVQIYNRVLTSSEILQNYNATKGRFGL